MGRTGREFGQWQRPVKRATRPLFGRLWKITVEGAENVPDSGAAILTPNHVSVMDSFFVPFALDRRITYVGKAEYLDDWKTSRLFPNLGMIPIDRSGGDKSQAALDKAAELLRAGELFGIYPEGTRSRSGKLHKGRTGPARLALLTGAPIIPVGLLGTREVQPPDAPRPKMGLPVTVRFGAPIHPERYASIGDRRLALRRYIDEVMFEIANLSGQDYVHVYAGAEDTTPASSVEVPELSVADAKSSAAVLRHRPLEPAA